MKKSTNWINESIIYIFPVIALILSFYAKETSFAAKKALYLCLDVVIPSLFPFFVLSRLTIPYLSSFSCPSFLKRFAEKFFRLPYYTLITIILGYLSGYPTGAKLSRDMLDEGLVDSQQASRMLSVTNNCSPLFMIGTIGAGLYKSVRIGFFLLLIHWVSGLFSAFVVGRISNASSKLSEKAKLKNQYIKGMNKNTNETAIFQLIPPAIEEAAILSIKVTGYIVLFAVLSELLSQIGVFSFLASIPELFLLKTSFSGVSELISSSLRGVMEITSGSHAISQIEGSSLDIKLSIISLICGFAGLSVHTQVMGIMKGTKVKYKVFFLGKLIHGITAGLITFIIMNTAPMSVSTSSMVSALPQNYPIIRLMTIGTIVLSLCFAPYKSEKSNS